MTCVSSEVWSGLSCGILSISNVSSNDLDIGVTQTPRQGQDLEASTFMGGFDHSSNQSHSLP